ncbi:MAG: hypothetical protein ACXACU_00810 [Candidatus Hodarchaeales archaeon]|jgi:hypothetical protein
MTENQTKTIWYLELRKILYFWIKGEAVLFLVTVGFLVIHIVLGNPNNLFSVETIKLALDIKGGISIICGFTFLAFFSLTSNREHVVRTAARFRSPKQLSYSNDIIKRQMDDWHRAMGTILLIICGFLVLVISYRTF